MPPTSPSQRATNRNFHTLWFYTYNWVFWRLCGTNWWSDQWYFPSGSFSPEGPSASTRGSGYTRPESWSLTAIRCLKYNNSTAARQLAARLAKINNAGQRQWCELVAPRRSPWKAGPDIELATISGLAMLALQSATGRLAEPLRVWRSIHGQPRPVA